MLTIKLFGRPNCHLCDQVKADLAEFQTKIPHQLDEINIETDSSLLNKYLSEIPVLEIGTFVLRAPITKNELLVALGAAQDAENQRKKLTRKTERDLPFADRFSVWIARHWLFAVNLMFILYLGLPILAPALMKIGAELPARIIYTAYSPLCHQLGFRSFFLFGEQPYYPRSAAGIPGVITFGQATQIDENDLIAARKFVGNDMLGYKIALCERDVAIYGAIILFGFLFGLTRRKIKPLHWALWFLFAIGPIGLDGFSQLFSQIQIPMIASFLPYRESTPFLRIFTGFLFGFGTAWFGLPYVEESMKETLDLLDKKLSVGSK
ncbi:MAG: DUF2085 domain-containing protein [Chloroflexota bacterium]